MGLVMTYQHWLCGRGSVVKALWSRLCGQGSVVKALVLCAGFNHLVIFGLLEIVLDQDVFQRHISDPGLLGDMEGTILLQCKSELWNLPYGPERPAYRLVVRL
ncbi:hypothetical protein DPMN_136694, partial [Dreissena polymorpha]